MPLVTNRFLAALDRIRGITGRLGLHVFTVTERTITDTAERPGLAGGTVVRTDVVITVGNGQPPKVEQVNTQDVFRSGGKYQSGDYRIGPLTPSYGTGGLIESNADPVPSTASLTVMYNIAGPGMPTGGLWCSLISEEESSMHVYLVVRANAAYSP